MLSRVACSLFWMARYLERVENSARFLGVTHSYAQELRGISHGAADECWGVASALFGETSHEQAGSVFPRLTFDETVPNSILASVIQARENARGIRDAISSEMWEELNVLYLRLIEEAAARPTETSVLALLQRVRNASHVFQGLRDHTMMRSDEWHFLRLGQFLERANITIRIMDAMFHHPALQVAADGGHNIDMLHLTVTLRCCTAWENFSRNWHTVTPEATAGFLLLDNRFSRSVEFCVKQVGISLHALSGSSPDDFANEAEQISGKLSAELRFAGIEEVIAQGLREYLLGVLGRLSQLGAAINEEYFL